MLNGPLPKSTCNRSTNPRHVAESPTAPAHVGCRTAVRSGRRPWPIAPFVAMPLGSYNSDALGSVRKATGRPRSVVASERSAALTAPSCRRRSHRAAPGARRSPRPRAPGGHESTRCPGPRSNPRVQTEKESRQDMASFRALERNFRYNWWSPSLWTSRVNKQ